MSLQGWLFITFGDPYVNDEGKLCVDMNCCGEITKYYLSYDLDGRYKLEEIGKHG